MQTKPIKQVQHGGARENAGRKPTGRKRFVAYVTDDERDAILQAVPRLAEPTVKIPAPPKD